MNPSTTATAISIVKGNSTDDTSMTKLQPEKTSVGNTTVVSYQKTTYDPKRLVSVDPVLGDIVIGRNELVILRGGWSNRNGIFFHEDPKSTDGFSTVNIIWKGVTPSK